MSKTKEEEFYSLERKLCAYALCTYVLDKYKNLFKTSVATTSRKETIDFEAAMEIMEEEMSNIEQKMCNDY